MSKLSEEDQSVFNAVQPRIRRIRQLRAGYFRIVRIAVVLIAPCTWLSGCSAFNEPLDVVDGVELGRYTGRWYEIARYPNSFERGCAGVTADYTLRPDGKIRVLNTCREGSLEGDVCTIEGVARVVDKNTNAKLAVSFFPPFEGAYWILELGGEYEYVVVGEPSRNFLWILSRTPTIENDVYEGILSRLLQRGYDPSRLLEVEQEQ